MIDQKLLKKYFQGRCSEEELDRVLDWLRTKEGRRYLEKHIDEDTRWLIDNQHSFLYPEIASEQIFSRIQKNKKQAGKREWIFIRVAAVLLIAVLISSVLYWAGKISTTIEEEINYVSYSAEQGQHKVLTLADGSKVRLNEGAHISFRESFGPDKRKIALEGEAYFEVAHDPNRPFIVHADGSVVQVLGTKFNVKIDSLSRNVQVAVLEGKVSLQKEGTETGPGAVLTRNHFGTLRMENDDIIIEQGDVTNYLSWINGRLVFNNDPLWKISRQLERLFHVAIDFESEKLRKMNLSADFEKTDLKDALHTISRTLDIAFKRKNGRVVWTEKSTGSGEYKI